METTSSYQWTENHDKVVKQLNEDFERGNLPIEAKLSACHDWLPDILPESNCHDWKETLGH